MANEKITMTLAPHEALVLFEFLAHVDQQASLIGDESERVVLAGALCILEKQLTAPFDPNYAELLASARRLVLHPEAQESEPERH